ncbi:MAG: TraX family protein, partial [Clostridia bacterium]
VVGCVKTRDPWKYGMRMLLLAVVSQPLYMMALSHTWTDFSILFALLLGIIAIQGIRARFLGSEIWAPALCYIALGFMNVDYGWRGLTFMLVLYGARQTRGGLIAAYLAYALFWGAPSSPVTSLFGQELKFLTWPGLGTVFSAFFRLQGMIWLSLPLIVLNTRTGFTMPKWLGYALYPMHLVVLIVLRLLMGGATWATLVSGFLK